MAWASSSGSWHGYFTNIPNIEIAIAIAAAISASVAIILLVRAAAALRRAEAAASRATSLAADASLLASKAASLAERAISIHAHPVDTQELDNDLWGTNSDRAARIDVLRQGSFQAPEDIAGLVMMLNRYADRLDVPPRKKLKEAADALEKLARDVQEWIGRYNGMGVLVDQQSARANTAEAALARKLSPPTGQRMDEVAQEIVRLRGQTIVDWDEDGPTTSPHPPSQYTADLIERLHSHLSDEKLIGEERCDALAEEIQRLRGDVGEKDAEIARLRKELTDA